MRWMTALLAATSGFARAADVPVVGAPEPRSVQSLIQDLDDPRWPVRESATDALIERGPAVYDPMRSAFEGTRSHEVRHRIKQIAREIYVTEAIGPAPAFLGIQRDPSRIPDPRIPGDSKSELVRAVIARTAAERAGIRSGDLIMSLNGDWITDKHPAEGFVRWIEKQRPGTPCRLGVLRGGRGFELRDELQQLTPEQLDKIKFEIATHEDDPRIPENGAGLRIERDPDILVGPGWPLDLSAGDLILAMDRKLIAADGAEQAVDRWFHPTPAPDERESDEESEKDDGSTNEAEHERSLHVLRGGRWMDFDVTLGRRPPQTWNDDRLTEMRLGAVREFQVWWRDAFDPAGLVGPADPAGNDADWRRPRPTANLP